ncbi:MAG: nucleotidyltransferase domain-containing protein [Candidatus Omnitrophota bacterium]
MMEKIFSTKERIKILKAIIFSEKPISVLVIAAKLRISKGLVSKYFDVLAKEGIAKRVNGKYSKYLITDSIITKGIRILLNTQAINSAIFRKYDFVEAVGLYGSCVKGENTEDSDVDIWFKIKDAGDAKIAPLTAEINNKIRNAKPLFLTAQKIEKMKKGDELFYHSLAFGSIIIYGGKDAIQL